MMTESNLIVSEKFYSIQGEGQTVGIPAVFLRLAGCNLDCTWCDSVEVWKKGTKTPFSEVISDEWVDRLRDGAHLIFTGGEPLLHQKKIIEYLEWFSNTYNFIPILEVETNGTILPEPSLRHVVDYWNVAPKLKNSNEPWDKRMDDVAITYFNSVKNSIFKFVIGNRAEFAEVLQDWKIINMNKIYLMPQGDSKAQLAKTYPLIAELAVDMGVKFSPRLHINIWNQKTGV